MRYSVEVMNDKKIWVGVEAEGPEFAYDKVMNWLDTTEGAAIAAGAIAAAMDFGLQARTVLHSDGDNDIEL